MHNGLGMVRCTPTTIKILTLKIKQMIDTKKKQCTIPFVRCSAVLVEEIQFKCYRKTPIWVVDITDGFFPVKFEYKAKGYKGLVFSEQLSRIEFD